MPGPSTELIRRVPLFADADDAFLQRLADEFIERTYAPGETITVEGEAGRTFVVIESGDVTKMRTLEAETKGAPLNLVVRDPNGTQRPVTVKPSFDKDQRTYVIGVVPAPSPGEALGSALDMTGGADVT